MGKITNDKTKKKVKRLKPISLYPLSFEQALEAILHTPPPDEKHKAKKTQKGKKKKDKQ